MEIATKLLVCAGTLMLIAGVPLDHSFLKYKKELCDYGYEVVKISMKAQAVLFAKRQEGCFNRKIKRGTWKC